MFNKLIEIINVKKGIFFYSLFIIKGLSYQTIKKIFSGLGINVNCYNYQFNFMLASDSLLYKNLSSLCIDFEHKAFFFKETLRKKFDMYMKIQHYKGKRLIKCLPMNGQRTHTNSKTIKRLSNAKNKSI